MGGLRPGNQHSADDEIGPGQMLANGVGVGVDGVDVGRHRLVDLAQAVEVDVDDHHVGPHPGGDAGRPRAHHAGPEHEHVAGLDPRHPAEQHTPPAVRVLQVVGALLDRELAGDLAHGCEQRQPPAVVGERLVGDRDALAVEAPEGELLIGSEVKVGEDRLAPADHRNFLRLGLLDLDDRVRLRPHLVGPRNNRRPGDVILLVGESSAQTRAGLDEHGVALLGEQVGADRAHRDPVLVRLHFGGDAHDHDRRPPASAAARRIRMITGSGLVRSRKARTVAARKAAGTPGGAAATSVRCYDQWFARRASGKARMKDGT